MIVPRVLVWSANHHNDRSECLKTKDCQLAVNTRTPNWNSTSMAIAHIPRQYEAKLLVYSLILPHFLKTKSLTSKLVQLDRATIIFKYKLTWVFKQQGFLCLSASISMSSKISNNVKFLRRTLFKILKVLFGLKLYLLYFKWSPKTDFSGLLRR